jgi:low temperature requirement protein LtrA
MPQDRLRLVAGPARRPRVREGEEERVKPLELFFDLIFVFAATQVTAFVVEDPTWAGLVRGMVLLGVLWWAWAAYAWLTNTIDPDEGAVRLAVFGAMGAMFVASLAVPDAFGDDAFLFASAYAVLRVAHLVLYGIGGWGDRELLAAIARLGAGTVVGVGLLFVAATLDGPLQVALWVVALVFDLLGAVIGGGRGWRLSPGHFAERHALVIIVALGESIVALGLGAPRELDAGVVAAALLGLAIACGLWWAYFDVVAIVAERTLHKRSGKAQLTMARDSYSYLHLPMVAGIILYAVGVKKTMADVGDPLKLVPAVALCGGLALYLVAHVLFRLRNVHTFSPRRLVVSALLVASIPLAVELPALATLALVAALVIGLIAYESIRYADDRERVRHGDAAG